MNLPHRQYLSVHAWLRPGTCFATSSPHRLLRPAVPMEAPLSDDVAGALEAQGRRVVHAAHAVTVVLPLPPLEP